MAEQFGFSFDGMAPASIVEPAVRARPAAATPPPATIAPAVAPQRNIDSLCRYCTRERPSALVSWFLIASWAYYICDQPLLSDGCFDELCRSLAAAFDGIEHRHKHLVDATWLSAGTCPLARTDYPIPARAAAVHLAWTNLQLRIPVS